MPDWNDSHIQSKRANVNVSLAEKYHESRKAFAEAEEFLNLKLALRFKSYPASKSIALDKLYITLVEDSIGTPEEELIKGYYHTLIQERANYKGLEKVLKAHEARLSMVQSLIKNKLRNT